jgi:hypothetical protein
MSFAAGVHGAAHQTLGELGSRGPKPGLHNFLCLTRKTQGPDV